MSLRALLAVSFSLLAGSGCALLQGEKHASRGRDSAIGGPAPRMDTSDLTAQLAPVAATPTAVGDTPIITAPLRLREALRLAVETSERIRAAGENLHQAHLTQIQAVSTILPTVNFRAAYFRQEDDFPAAPTGVRIGSLLTDQTTTRFELRAPLLRVGSYLAIAQAASVIEVAEAQVRAERLLVEQLTGAAFYAALTAERQAQTFASAIDRDVERLREIRGREAAGIARRTEVLFVETDLARTQAALGEARERLAEAREILALLVGRPVAAQIVEPPLPEGMAPADMMAFPLQRHVDDAFARRPDIRALRAQIEVEEGFRRVAIGGFAPNIDATANYWLKREGTLEDVSWDATIELVVPVFEGLLISTRVREAESRKRQAEDTLRAGARRVAADIASAYRALRAAAASRAAQEEALRAADANFALLEAEYRTGIATNLEVVAAQQELTATRLGYETARLDEQRLALELYFLTGGPEEGIR